MKKYVITFVMLFMTFFFCPFAEAKEQPPQQSLFILPYQNKSLFTEKFNDKNFLFWRFSKQKWGYAEVNHFFHNIPSSKEKKRLSPLQEEIIDIFLNPNYPSLERFR